MSAQSSTAGHGQGLSRDELEKQLAERAKNEPRVAQSLAGGDPKDLTLETLVALLRM